MIWLWILGILIVLAALASRLRIGVRARFGEEPLLVELTLGPFRVPLTGGKETEKPPEQTKKSQKSPKKRKTAAGSGFPKVTLADVREGIRVLAPVCKKALGRTRRGIRVDPFTVSVTIGAAGDPALGAEVYGWASGAMFHVMPALEELVWCPDPSVHIGLDFDSAAARAEGSVGLSLTLGTLFGVGLGLGVPVLRWLSDLRKKQRTAPPPAELDTAHSGAA